MSGALTSTQHVEALRAAVVEAERQYRENAAKLNPQQLAIYERDMAVYLRRLQVSINSVVKGALPVARTPNQTPAKIQKKLQKKLKRKQKNDERMKTMARIAIKRAGANTPLGQAATMLLDEAKPKEVRKKALTMLVDSVPIESEWGELARMGAKEFLDDDDDDEDDDD